MGWNIGVGSCLLIFIILYSLIRARNRVGWPIVKVLIFLVIFLLLWCYLFFYRVRFGQLVDTYTDSAKQWLICRLTGDPSSCGDLPPQRPNPNVFHLLYFVGGALGLIGCLLLVSWKDFRRTPHRDTTPGDVALQSVEISEKDTDDDGVGSSGRNKDDPLVERNYIPPLTDPNLRVEEENIR